MKITETATRIAQETGVSAEDAHQELRPRRARRDHVRAKHVRVAAPSDVRTRVRCVLCRQREKYLRVFDDAIDVSRELAPFGFVTRFVLRRARSAAAKALRFPQPEPVFRDGVFVGVRAGPRS